MQKSSLLSRIMIFASSVCSIPIPMPHFYSVKSRRGWCILLLGILWGYSLEFPTSIPVLHLQLGVEGLRLSSRLSSTMVVTYSSLEHRLVSFGPF